MLTADARVPPSGQLRRGLRRIDIVALTLNNIVGAGIFTMPAALVAGAGSWSVGVLLVTIALVAAGGLYALLLFACFATVPDLGRSTRPLADAASALIGPVGTTVILMTATISCAGSLSGWMVASPRVPYALAVHGDVPRVLAAVDPVWRTPSVAILLSGFLVWLIAVSGTFVYLATFSAMARLLTYASTCGALIALRRRDGPAPIEVPFGPALAVIALTTTALTLGSTTVAGVRDLLIAIAVGWGLRIVTRQWNGNPAASYR